MYMLKFKPKQKCYFRFRPIMNFLKELHLDEFKSFHKVVQTTHNSSDMMIGRCSEAKYPKIRKLWFGHASYLLKKNHVLDKIRYFFQHLGESNFPKTNFFLFLTVFEDYCFFIAAKWQLSINSSLKVYFLFPSKSSL